MKKRRLAIAPGSLPSRASRRLFAVACVLLLHAAACEASSTIEDGRDWLGLCQADGDCARGTCACGLCTIVCAHNSQCEGARGASCYQLESPGVTSLCGVDVARQLRASRHDPAGICLATCGNDAACPTGELCKAGVCLPPAATLDAGALMPDAGFDTADAGRSDAATPGGGADAAPDSGRFDAGPSDAGKDTGQEPDGPVYPEPPASALAQGACSADGWCWDRGAPQGGGLTSVYLAPDGELFAASGRFVLHWDGAGWTLDPLPFSTTEPRLWGRSSDDVWRIGSEVHHWNGSTWELVPRPSLAALRSISGDPGGNPWVVDTAGVLHWENGDWRPVDASALDAFHIYDLWVAAPDDLWIAANGVYGQDGTIFHHDGTAWAQQTNGHSWLEAIWGASSGELWSVGEHGTVLHYDGITWTRSNASTIEHLHDVHGCGEDDVWVVGDHGTVRHWDGSAWSDRSPPTHLDLRSVFCQPGASAWVVGERGVMLRWDGDWSAVTTDRTGSLNGVAMTATGPLVTGDLDTLLERTPSGWTRLGGTPAQSYPDVAFLDMHGTGPNDIWAVGTEGAIAHWNGAAWNVLDPVASYDLESVWAFASDDVWAVGAEGAVLHYDGNAWTPRSAGHDVTFYELWGSAPGDLWATGWNTLQHWNGTDWTKVGGANAIQFNSSAIWGAASDDVWALVNRRVMHWNGEAWSQQPVSFPTSPTNLHGSSASNVWVSGSDYLLHWNAVTWQRHDWTLPGSAPGPLWVASPTDVWGVTFRASYHWNGVDWTSTPAPTVRGFGGIWGVDTAHLYTYGAVGSIARWTGAAWQPEAPAVDPRNLGASWVESDESIWVVGDLGTIRRWNGSGWEEHDSGTDRRLFAITGLAGDDIWVSGEAGTLLHYDGMGWLPVASGTSTDIVGLWAAPNGHILAAVGDYEANATYDGEVLRYDGMDWTFETVPNVTGLRAIWGASEDDIWAVGSSTSVHWNGTSWTQVALDGSADLRAIWGADATHIWAVGSGGRIQFCNGSAWSAQASPGDNALVGISGNASTVWAVGAEGAIWRFDR